MRRAAAYASPNYAAVLRLPMRYRAAELARIRELEGADATPAAEAPAEPEPSEPRGANATPAAEAPAEPKPSEPRGADATPAAEAPAEPEPSEPRRANATPAAEAPAEPEPSEPRGADDLYILRYVGILQDVLKVGRSNNPEKRRRALEACQNFHLELLAIFPGKGHLEAAVHLRLEEHRSTRGAGNEWFRIDLQGALRAVAMASFERECVRHPLGVCRIRSAPPLATSANFDGPAGRP